MKVLHHSAWLLSLALLAAAAAPALAAGRHGDQLTDIVAQLDLTAAQQDKVNNIVSDLQQKVHSIRKAAKASGDTAGARAKAKDARHEAIKNISALLTDDQKTKFHDLLKQAEEQHKAAKAEKTANSTTQPAQQ